MLQVASNFQDCNNFIIYLLNASVGGESSSVALDPSSSGNERDTLSPTPLMGSNKLGMAIGWSSAFETQAVDTVDGTAIEQTDQVGPLPSPQEPLSPMTPTKIQNVPSFGTLLKDYTVQGPNRFEAPVYADGAVPTQPQQVEILYECLNQ